jgi:hypothetical protein
MWLPASVRALQKYDRGALAADLIAGVTVGLVALPLAMAFAISSGVEPQAGIYCAIVTGFLISALGGSRFQIGGPTGAFVVVVAAIVRDYGLDGLFMCTMMAGRVSTAAAPPDYRRFSRRISSRTGMPAKPGCSSCVEATTMFGAMWTRRYPRRW